MMSIRNLLTAVVACGICLLPWAVTAQGIDHYSAVTEERLLQPEVNVRGSHCSTMGDRPPYIY
jgi:hypothetical protein